MSDRWLQINIYPNARRGFVAVVVECTGYTIQCDSCQKRRCPRCSDTKRGRVVKSVRADLNSDTKSTESIVEFALEVLSRE